MKRTLIIIAALAVAFTACRKKTPATNCYTFYVYDSVSSNVPVFVKNTVDSSQNHCGYTDQMRNNFIRQYSGTDTVKLHDTVIVHHYNSTWDYLN